MSTDQAREVLQGKVAVTTHARQVISGPGLYLEGGGHKRDLFENLKSKIGMTAQTSTIWA